MAPITAEKRKQMEKLIYDTFNALDPSGTNTGKYKALYGGMSDSQFDRHMKGFLGDAGENFILDINELDRRVTMDQCEKAAKVIGVPVEEYVFMPWLTMDRGSIIRSKQKCIVGWINVKRTQQLLHEKNGLSTSAAKTSHLTGQVIGDDKNARDSDIEATLLVSMGADDILRELHGPRADDAVMQRQMMSDISTKGYVALDEMESVPSNKATLTLVNATMIGMGLKTDLINDTYILPKTIDELLD